MAGARVCKALKVTIRTLLSCQMSWRLLEGFEQDHCDSSELFSGSIPPGLCALQPTPKKYKQVKWQDRDKNVRLILQLWWAQCPLQGLLLCRNWTTLKNTTQQTTQARKVIHFWSRLGEQWWCECGLVTGRTWLNREQHGASEQTFICLKPWSYW